MRIGRCVFFTSANPHSRTHVGHPSKLAETLSPQAGQPGMRTGVGTELAVSFYFDMLSVAVLIYSTGECKLGDKGNTTFCASATCSLCCIMRSSFDLSLFGKKTGWGRYENTTIF